jgi:LacI family transcriptional regulator
MTSSSSTRRREATVADVAAEAKVSKAQAARALGGYGAVSDDVRTRVLEAAAELGYRPNMLARSMNTGKSQTIGVVVGDIENPYFGLAMRGISDTAKRAGYDVVLVNTGEDHASEVDAVRVLQDKRVDGLIVAPALAPDSTHLQAVVDSGRPLVLLDRRIRGLDVDVVAAQGEQAAFDATRLLLAAGHERISYISTIRAAGQPSDGGQGLGLTPVAERLAGMKRAFRHEGKEFPESLVRLNAGPEDNIRRIVASLLADRDRVTAIVASDSVIALTVLEELHAEGVEIPADLSFIMFDDMPWTRILTPPLTVVSQPVYELGAASAGVLVSRIRGEAPQPVPEFPAQLIERESVGPPPATGR